MTRPLPLWIVTGFLGSGKTTLIRSLIRRPEFGRLAIVINEFGEIGLDHDIIEASSDDVYALAGGCLCCMVRGELGETLADMFARRAVGELPAFDGVVIETSGLADPGPVEELLSGQPLRGFFRLAAIVTVCDAVNGARTLAQEAVATAQAKAADILVITKADLAPGTTLTALETRLRDYAPDAALARSSEGRLDQDLVDALIRAVRPERRRAKTRTGPPAHDFDRIRSRTLTLDTPLEPRGLEACVSVLKALAGPHLMRAKALIVLPPPQNPVILQAVQDTIYPPMRLAAVTHESPLSRMILITRGIEQDAIDAALRKSGLADSVRKMDEPPRHG
ncbi:MAG TPA: GTP-binding protein [Alphaproteobacteria bacterium]|nr:GTP-binding protein [Alphaproteobacteria bacterium]